MPSPFPATGRYIPALRAVCVLAIAGRLFAAGPADASKEASPAPRTLVISAVANEQTHAMAKDVLRHAYGLLGIGVRFDDLPGQRALEWANSGRTDGDLARIEGTQSKYPNLVCVHVPVIHFHGVAFCKDRGIRADNWADLGGLRVGVVRGIRYSTLGTDGMAPYFANDMTHLFTILDRGRIEVAVAVRNAGRIEIAKNFAKSGIRVCGEPLFSAPLYHFLHKRNKALVAELESVLSRMSESGEMEALWRQAFQRLLAH